MVDYNQVREQITNVDVPVVIKNRITDWNVMKFKKKDWCDVFNSKLLRFRTGTKQFRQEPYWEGLCGEKLMTLENFFQSEENDGAHSSQSNNWLYYDYKYMQNVFEDNHAFLKDIKWSDLGFSNLSGKDSTIWVGNEGAHTPCHMDTYGCNIVAQIYGRKLWILIPPEETENLGPTRVPYEESSVYCRFNFYTPSKSILSLKNVFQIVLNPGDILYVPKHWWHYVENLEVAISINTWIPLEVDHESRLEEALVRSYICGVCQELAEDEAKSLLNPNEYEILNETLDPSVFQKVVENCTIYRREKDNVVETVSDTKPRDMLEPVPQIDILDFFNSKTQKCTKEEDVSIAKFDKLNVTKILINSFCNPRNIALVKENLLKNL